MLALGLPYSLVQYKLFKASYRLSNSSIQAFLCRCITLTYTHISVFIHAGEEKKNSWNFFKIIKIHEKACKKICW